MAEVKTKTGFHPTDAELADFLSSSLSAKEARALIEKHLSSCNECLAKAVSAYESVRLFRKGMPAKRKGNFLKRLNIYLVLALLSFLFSFMVPRYFLQLLVATLVLGIKWVVDSKSAKMLIMIYEAWRKGGEKEASRILETIDREHKGRGRF